MQEIIPYYKELGLSPLQSIDRLRSERPELLDVPITYAGRLDPMAEGLLLLLVGDAVHKKDEFNKLDKTYEAKILLGFSSDTFDILGLAEQDIATPKNPQLSSSFLNTVVQDLIGTHQFNYPNYSSKTVDGKPMWLHTRENSLKDIQIPEREMTVLSPNITDAQSISWKQIFDTIISSIALVDGEFRQDEILTRWEEINKTLEQAQEFQILNITFKVSSGTYIRTLANELGRLLNTKALLFNLKRTEVGSYKI